MFAVANNIIQRAGFHRIDSSGSFTSTNEAKGIKLRKSKHVFYASERFGAAQNFAIKGDCIRQANADSVNKESYTVSIQILTIFV